MKKSFFSKFDWAAFWTATFVTFAVYFYTLGPSVGLEDSGELATAAAHLGVPHPPGYPFWTLCSWIFCKVFSFVTYMGHPTPAWAVSCCSAVFGAFAAGCTAMLICRSAHDFIVKDDASDAGADWLSFGGGVGGALAFSFSPVEWSQSTIVEIYSLNALFLMWVFLLSYRWMKRPSDKILWFTAFVFGLGLTNYQVLLFAIVPIAIIICLRNFSMFRDFLLYLIPVALTCQVLQIGELQRANEFMTSDVINKHMALKTCASTPSTAALVFAFVALVAGMIVAAVLRARGRRDVAKISAMIGGGVALAVMAFAVIGIFAGEVSWPALSPNQGTEADITAPLVNPRIYVWVAMFMVVSVVCGVLAALWKEDGDENGSTLEIVFLVGAAVSVLIAVAIVYGFVGEPSSYGYQGKWKYDWNSSEFICTMLVMTLLAVSLFVKRGLSYSIPVAGFQIVLFLLLRRGAMNGLVHPTSWWFWWPVVWNFVVLALAWIVLPHGRSVAGAAFFAQLGVSFYAYMPIVSDIRNPPMNWGYPRTWDGFKHAITRGQYEAITIPEFTSFKVFWEFIKEQMGHYFADVKMQFSDFLAFFALVPFACWGFVVKAKSRKVRVTALWAVSGILALLLVRALMVGFGVGDGEGWQVIDRILLALMALASLVGVVSIAWGQVLVKTTVATRRFVETAIRGRDYRRLGAFAALALIGVSFAARPYVVWVRNGGKAGSWLPLVLTLLVLCAFALLVLGARGLLRFRRSLHDRPCVPSFHARGVTQQWLIASGVSFFVMSVPLIVLAKVKGDLQDGFIQKVKFISSHAMIALWIGYGLVLVGVVLRNLAAGGGRLSRRAVAWLAAGLAAVMILSAAIAPIYQNYADDGYTERIGVSELVHKFGGSEQNDHTFGWQFGAYQLDGAKAIREQLTADEEPLPDPDWPPPMDPFAIFFGGTDPGRFVPTYMIYSANFRPDVYLITQNALADETYMAVQRDLYGDEIWIPSKEDSGEAFNIYVDEVKRGVRPANGDLKIENGRVQVTGALGVMEINGILTKMMHDHDRLRHSFYVEESYAIPWMYPYLSPHGLIMKLNADRTPYDPKTAAKDRDFWDWYTRRLVDDPMFRRDFAAQKSFSKLRAAIAGLYRSQGRRADAAQAFREAHVIYPPSPEATFRYVSEMLIPLDRLSVISELMDYTDVLDPNGGRTARIRSYVTTRRTIDRLEGKRRSGPLSTDEEWTLAECYANLGHLSEAARRMARLLPGVTDLKRLEGAVAVFIGAKDYASAERAILALFRVVRRPPPEMLAELVVVQHRLGKRGEAYATLDKAIRVNPKMARDRAYAYLAGLEPGEQDVTLWLRLARQFRRGKDMPRAQECLIRAFNLAPERAQEDCRRDDELYRIFQTILKEQSQRRR